MKRKRKDTREIDRSIQLEGRLIHKTKPKRYQKWESSRYRERIRRKQNEMKRRYTQNMRHRTKSALQLYTGKN